MGVDLNTYRCRVGMFVADHGAGAVIINFSRLMKIIGCVRFVRILLIMSGIEQNPGPDTFTFRYQYLLVHIGTEVLRELFLAKAGIGPGGVGQFLTSKSKEIEKLAKARMISVSQKEMLLSVNKPLCITDLDITLLSCILRNVCGLCPVNDPVWMNPAQTDPRTEADIARLRICRNELMHSDKLRLPDAELKAKWTELSAILIRLNQIAGVPQLQKKIDKAERLNVDEELWNEYNEVLKAWEDKDEILYHRIGALTSEVSGVQHELVGVKSEVSGVKHELVGVTSEVSSVKHELVGVKSEVSGVQHELVGVKSEVSGVQHELVGVKSEVSGVKHELVGVKSEVSGVQHELVGVKSEVSGVKHELVGIQRKLEDVEQQGTKVVDFSDIQQDIIENYKHRFKTLPVSPLFENIDEDLLHVYQSPTMHSVEPTKEDPKQVSSYEEIFCKDSKICKHIYITGDAGVGKTSFCRRLCLLWAMVKCSVEVDNEALKKDIDYISEFDYVFYITLRETRHIHVVDMIIEQFCKSEEKYEPKQIKSVLRNEQCLVVLDGMDEWSPQNVEKYKILEKVYSENCVYLTTCRPYRLESVRLSHNKDIDHQIQMTGISGLSSENFVKKVVDNMDQRKSCDKKSSDFVREVEKCGLTKQLCIPMIASHLVILWYEKSLTGMPRAVIYGNILEMLFKRAENRKIQFPPSATSTYQLPNSLSGLKYLNKYVSFIYKLCYLSFCSMFKKDDNVMSLVFTRDELESEPFCFSIEETDFLCKIGILSRNEVFGCYFEEKMKISFIHASYLEFFAALFISSFDSNNSFTDVTKTWNCLDDVLPCENLLLLLAGFSYDGIKQLFDNIYLQVSDDLSLFRRNAIFLYPNNFYRGQIQSLQNIVVNCFKEFSISKTTVIQMEDFIFGHVSNVDILRQLLLLNTTCVKSIYSVKGEYYPEFDQIYCLQYLSVGNVSSANIEKFTLCMLHNKSLHTVCIKGDDDDKPLIPELTVRNFRHLTSLSLSYVKIQHDSLYNVVKFLSENILIENIKLSDVPCVDHQDDDINCTLTLNLPQHTKLTSLYLDNVNILSKNVNSSSLQYITLCPFSEMIVRLCYSDLFNCVKNSQLEHLGIYCKYGYILDYNAMKTLTSTVKTLPCIKSLELFDLNLPDDVLLQLHPDVTQAKIELGGVTMSCQCFHCFVESCVNIKSEIKVSLYECNIISVDGETHSKLSHEESVKYMSEYLESFSTINITYKDDTTFYSLCFETTRCQ